MNYKDQSNSYFPLNDLESRSQKKISSSQFSPTQSTLSPSTSFASSADQTLDDSNQTGFRLAARFEPIVLTNVLILIVFVGFSFVIGYLVPLKVLKNQTLFVSRTAVAGIGTLDGLLCSFALGLILRRHYDASVWSILIQADPSPHLKLKEVDSWLESITMWKGVKVLWFQNSKKNHIRKKKWGSLFFFILALFVGTLTAFLYGRTVTIATLHYSIQRRAFTPLEVVGTVTPQEVKQTVDLAKNGLERDLPLSAAFRPQALVSTIYPNTNLSQKIYYPELMKTYLEPQGYGYGASNFPNIDIDIVKVADFDVAIDVRKQPAASLLWERWSHRSNCLSFTPDLIQSNFYVSKNGAAFAFLPEQILSSVFASLNISIPSSLHVNQDFSSSNIPSRINQNWMIRANFSLDEKTLTVVSFFPRADPLQNFLITIDSLLFRRNISSDNGKSEKFAWIDKSVGIGYDLNVCVSIAESFIFEAFSISDLLKGGGLSPLMTPVFNASDFYEFHKAIAKTARKQFATSNTPYLVREDSATTLELMSNRTINSTKVERLLGVLTAHFTLPYFVGTGKIEARKYELDRSVEAEPQLFWMIVLFGSILVFGLLGAVFVPILPSNIKFRETTLSAFYPVLSQLDSVENGNVASAVSNSIQAKGRVTSGWSSSTLS